MTTSRLGTGRERLQHESPSNTPIDSVEIHGVSDPSTELVGQEQCEDKTPGFHQPQHILSSSGFAMHTDVNEEMVITSIRVTNVALGLRRLPTSFYTVVHHSGLEWRTKNMQSLVVEDVIEWSVLIPIPSDPSATVSLEVYASFDLQPMLGAEEQLRKLTITMGQLLDHSAKGVSFMLFPKDGDTISPCSTISVSVKRRKCNNGDSSMSIVVGCSTTKCRGELEDKINQGRRLLSHYQRHGGKQYLDRSVEQFEEAFNICPVNHPRFAVAMSNLAMAKFLQSCAEDTDVFSEAPLDLCHEAPASHPAGHADRPLMLMTLALVHMARFKIWRELGDLEDAISILRNVINLTSDDHPDKPNRLGSLGCFLLTRFEHVKELGDLDDAISSHKNAVELTSNDHPDRRSHLTNLGDSFLTRFEHLGKLNDLEGAISSYRNAVDLTSDDHSDKPTYLRNLGNLFFTRFEHLGELNDLEDAISRHRSVVELTPDGHPDKPARLQNLGSSLITRFRRLGELNDLDTAILKQRDAINLIPDDHTHKPGFFENLGYSHLVRFLRFGQLDDVKEAISSYTNAVELTPDDHPRMPVRLQNLGCSFLSRFMRFRELNDLEVAISSQKNAVYLTPDDHPDKFSRLQNLGSSLVTRFECLGKASDLDEGISLQKNAVDLVPGNHPDKPGCLAVLGNSLHSRFERYGKLNDLGDAISYHRNAIELTPDDHPDKPDRLQNLGTCLITRFEYLGELSDLDDGISKQRHAVNSTPNDHPCKRSYLTNLGYSFHSRFTRLGKLSDLEYAISYHRNAIDLTPHDHPRKPSSLINLGNSLITRFQRLGELSDLEEAISSYRNAFDLTPDDHPDKPTCHMTLGNSFLIRFRRFRELSDLEVGISSHRNAVDLTPDDHPDKRSHLTNLGSSFLTRFKCLGRLSDLNNAISNHKNAVELTPNDHPDKPVRLQNLGTSFLTRFNHLGELSDLEVAISYYRNAVDLTPHGHPDKPRYLSNLGQSLQTRFERLTQRSDLEQAIFVYLRAASDPTGSINVRIHASQEWISCARRIHHPSLLRAHSVAVNLLPQLAWIGLSLTRRYSELKRGVNVVREAAAAALDSGLPETAVEWLEQGRSIVWGELLQLRSSYEDLSTTHPDHSRRLQELSAALEHASVTHEKSLSVFSERTQSLVHREKESLQQEADKHRTLAIERDKLLEEIRRLPGFEGFLQHKKFSQLCSSAHSGPVVILNAASSRCDALIILTDVDHVIHVPLSKFSLKQSTELQNELKNFLHRARALYSEEREGSSVVWDNINWESILSPLWKCVVKPVLDAIAFSIPGNLSRIFWCPTGPFAFLPIHAAGFYDRQYSQPGYKVFDFVISSYVPTLAILGPLPNSAAVLGSGLRFLTVRQPESDGLPRLFGVNTELGYIRDIIRNLPSVSTILLESSVGMVEEVLSLMNEADWVHFACHGTQDANNPTNSGLCLANGRLLKLRDIIALSRPRGGLAFLSACQTAKGDERLSDEAVHIAAGMLFAGYGGVIGTMWSISDTVAPVVAKDVYENLFGNGTRPDYREAARALHGAIGRLRDGDAPFHEWLPFIHVGL